MRGKMKLSPRMRFFHEFTTTPAHCNALDRVLEFLIFKREAEKLLPELRDELVKIVRHHLRVDEAIADLKLEKRLENEETPLLDALGAKLGMSFTHILAPPVHKCLLCSKPSFFKNLV